MEERFERTKPQTIKQQADQFISEPSSDSALKSKIFEPSKTMYQEYEYDELVYRDVGLSNIPKELFQFYQQLFSLRQLESSFWLSLAPAEFGNEYASLSQLCNVENKFDFKLLCSSDGKLLQYLLAPPQQATIRQYSKNEGQRNAVQRMVNPNTGEVKYE
jgi:hypothetical protein